MVSRHYWPHLMIDSACRDLRLADALRRAGMRLEVWTPRFSADWSEHLTHRELVIHRPLIAPRGTWAARRYARQVREWFEAHGREYDIWLCTGVGEEWSSLTRAAGSDRIRKLLWHSGTGEAADHAIWSAAWGPRKLLGELNRADGIVVSWASAQRELLGMGVPAGRLHRIDIGVTAGVATGDGSGEPGSSSGPRTQSARCLAQANADLAVEHDTQVILACGRMGTEGGMLPLSRAFVSLAERWGDLRLWLVGDGPLRDTLHHYFRQQGVRQQVAMPGTFVDWEDVFHVADLLVLPSLADGLEDLLPAAVGAGIPLVVAEGPDTRAFFAGWERGVHWFVPGKVDQLRTAIQSCLIDRDGRREAARQLRREWLMQRPYQQTVTEFTKLVDSRGRAAGESSLGGVGTRSPTTPNPTGGRQPGSESGSPQAANPLSGGIAAARPPSPARRPFF